MSKEKSKRSQQIKSSVDPCYCGSTASFGECCEPLLLGDRTAQTAQELMRSRYSAYATQNAAYLRRTWHPDYCPKQLHLDPNQRWLGLKIKSVIDGGEHDNHGVVSFAARFKLGSQGHALREVSEFARWQGNWVYVQGTLETNA